MHTDIISDMLIRIKNGYMAKKETVLVPWSRSKEELSRLLLKNNYLAGVEIKTDGELKMLILELKYNQGLPAMTEVKRISKPSLRVYVRRNDIRQVLGGNGISVISTPKGLMTNREARKNGFGGEVWCEIW